MVTWQAPMLDSITSVGHAAASNLSVVPCVGYLTPRTLRLHFSNSTSSIANVIDVSAECERKLQIPHSATMQTLHDDWIAKVMAKPF